MKITNGPLPTANFPDINLDTLVFLSDLQELCYDFSHGIVCPQDKLTDKILEENTPVIVYDSTEPINNYRKLFSIDLGYTLLNDDNPNNKYPTCEFYYDKDQDEIEIQFFKTAQNHDSEALIYLNILKDGSWYVTNTWN